VILLRRPIERTVAVIDGAGRQLDLYFGEIIADPAAKVFEYAVLVTSLAGEVLTVAQLYRDRAAGENNFDELKNHWGWGGFTTQDLQRCRLMARIVALIYNWWSLFVRLADPDQHTEAITSRPLLLYGVGRQTRHANQTTITITSTHGKAERVRRKECRKFRVGSIPMETEESPYGTKETTGYCRSVAGSASGWSGREERV
jgi:hypothetical protein